MVRHRSLRIILIISIFATILVGSLGPMGVHSAWACSCVMPSPPNVAFGEANAVFSGRVTDISGGAGPLARLLSLVGIYREVDYRRSVTLEVVDSWKGVDATRTTINTYLGGGDCGYEFSRGSEYLIYGYENNGRLMTTICTRTTALSASSATDDLTFLATQPTIPLTPIGRSSAFIWITGIGGIVVLVSLAGFFFIKRWSWLKT